MDLFNQKPKERTFEKFILEDGEVWYMPNFMPLLVANNYFRNLLETINWKQEQIKMYGKVHDVPRKTAWYGYEGFSYKYSGILCDPDPWTEELLEIKKVIEHFIPTENFNSVLLNHYRDGNDKVGWHADDEAGLGVNPTIASVSLGATRRFDLKHKENKQRIDIVLENGSLLVMKKGTQTNWLHRLPPTKKVNSPRINLTFRTIEL